MIDIRASHRDGQGIAANAAGDVHAKALRRHALMGWGAADTHVLARRLELMITTDKDRTDNGRLPADVRQDRRVADHPRFHRSPPQEPVRRRACAGHRAETRIRRQANGNARWASMMVAPRLMATV